MTETTPSTGAGAATAILTLLIGFWLVMRSVNEDASGRTLIDRILGNKASKSPLLNMPVSSPASSTSGTGATGATTTTGTPGAGSVLMSLFPAGSHVTSNRHDQGRDLQGPANSPIFAPGNGTLIRNATDPSGFGVSYPIVHFTTGPWAGLDIYFGHVKSLLSGGSFNAGQPIAMTQSGSGPYVGNATSPGWTEIGLAPGGNPGPMGQPLPPGL